MRPNIAWEWCRRGLGEVVEGQAIEVVMADEPKPELDRSVKYEEFTDAELRVIALARGLKRTRYLSRSEIIRRIVGIAEEVQAGKRVLILGNGISRLIPEIADEIESWKGELWGSNKAYLDFWPRLDRLNGHGDVMQRAVQFRRAAAARFRIMVSQSGLALYDHDECLPYRVGGEWLKDSGTAHVSEALQEGFAEIVCAGFDFGGKDVYSDFHEEQTKVMWIRRWRYMAKKWGLERIRFLGHDHKPFIQSNRWETNYARFYNAGRPHIPGDEYRKVWETHKAHHKEVA